MRTVFMGVGVAVAAAAVVSPVLRAEEKLAPPTRAELVRSQNNLKQIVLAFHNFADTYGGPIPTDFRSKDGTALLSWRVAILPYIEEVELYKQFKLDEPWDSETNKKLIAKLPKVYAPVRVKGKEGETFYQVFAGEKAVFGPKAQPRIPASFPDGTSNTGLVFEAGEPVIWTKPADLAFDEKKALPKLGGLFDGDFHVGLADGSVIRCKKDADETELKKLIMPADGTVIDMTKLKK
ncbi:MAG: hypothetical protein JWO38_1489 [Gemmataceae bacterium]|nr:hypothetical protein [Gemmataceae bacterium]